MTPDGATSNLAERLQGGDTSAEAALVDKFYARIYAMTLARTGEQEIARDLSQEVMLAVLRALREGRLRRSDNLAAYVLATARNRVSYYYRRRGVRSEVPLPAALESDLPDPEEHLEDSQRREAARLALSRLSPTDRQVLYLSFYENLKPREISERLGLPSTVVRMRKSRALRRARAALEREVLRSGA